MITKFEAGPKTPAFVTVLSPDTCSRLIGVQMRTRGFHPWLAATIVLWTIAGCKPVPSGRQTASPETQPSTSATNPTAQPVLMPRNDLPGLTNFAQVSPVLYRGAQPTAEGFAQLNKMGIKTVVNLRSFHSDKGLLKGTGMHYINIPCKAWHPEEEDILLFLKVIEDPANQPVFVHCQQGSDRTGCAVASYRMVVQNWSREEATAELPRFNFHPIWSDIASYLSGFDSAKTQQKVLKTSAPDIQIIK